METPKLIAPFVWSVGDRRVQDLPTHLYNVMQYSTNSALAKLSSGDAEDSLICAVMLGLSVESAIKWALCKINPVLIAEKGSSKSRAFLAAPLSAPLAINALRTLNGTEAYSQWRDLRPEHPRVAAAPVIEEVLSVRNAAIHMGVVGVAELHAAARSAIKILRLIFDVEGEDIAKLWRPEFGELVDQLAEEQATVIRLRVTSKRVQAEANLKRLRWSRGDTFGEIATAISASLTAKSNGETLIAVDCPVCEYEGLLHRYISTPNEDFGGASYPHNRPSGYRYAYPEYFECSVCGMYFEGDEIDEDAYFEDFREEELEPSEEFYEALRSWEADEVHDLEREAYYRLERDEQRRELDGLG